MWDDELKIAREAAVKAGAAIMEIYEGDDFGVEYKADDSPLTKADKASNAIIVKVLRDRFPDYAILSEEEKDNKARLENDLCFVVDPLDGTKEFVKRNGQFTVNIALSYRHRAVMGVIYIPVSGELYYASEGDGAYLEKPDGSIERLSVSTNTDHSNLRAVASGSHCAEEMERLIEKYHIRHILRIGSSRCDDLDPKFCDVIRKRYFRFINKLGHDEDDTGWEDFTPKVEANHDNEKA